MKKGLSVTGVVLAGGKSSRMGTDKGLVMFRQKHLVEYPLGLLSRFCDRILISSNNPGYEKFGFEVIPDIQAGAGPMAGIAACLHQSRSEHNLVLSCDLPFLDPIVIETILRKTQEHTFVVPVDSLGRAEPMCAYYHKRSLPEIERLLGLSRYKMTLLFQHSAVKYLHPADFYPHFREEWFANFNTMDDIRSAE